VYIVITPITNVKVFITNMAEHILTNKEIIEKLKLISVSKTASELARKLGTERQNLKSYENKSSVDLNNRMITLLIDFIENERN